MKKNSKLNATNLNYFNLELNSDETRVLLIIVIILVIILLFRKKLNNVIERFIVFSILFLLFLVITKNILVTFIGSCIIFLFVNLIIRYRNTIENFEDLNKEPVFDTNIFDNEILKKSTEGIQDLLKKVNGGIELKEDDIKESDKLNVDHEKYADDKKSNIENLKESGNNINDFDNLIWLKKKTYNGEIFDSMESLNLENNREGDMRGIFMDLDIIDIKKTFFTQKL
jgi:hypothetical protein